ncbi:acyl-coenzyme A thioesterase 13 isoform X2 [Leucoraja erinacea]|uniref:acyl-coenzyme A thioesterase 13 isoform X2 n=1 Tax=Leucoraja erinaceus TaxID=7782 RepID=UPI0024549A88|nr:acyl-coenzyme A thioesterase 13 isoform X2 [Leucoraja erinacea]
MFPRGSWGFSLQQRACCIIWGQVNHRECASRILICCRKRFVATPDHLPRQTAARSKYLPMAGSSLNALRQVVRGLTGGTGFDRILNKMAVVSASPGKIICEMRVEEEHVNRVGILHGGLTATLIDVVSTTALLNTERALPGVSVDMNITDMKNSHIYCSGREKQGL